MKRKNWLTVLFLFMMSIKLYGQEVRVNNSFVILINDKLARSIAGLKLITGDGTASKNSINGGYYPGVLYVSNEQTKNLLYADSLKKITLKFDYYEYPGGKQIVRNYSIDIDRKWFKESLIIVKISDINKKRGTYNYTFEVPGYSFGTIKHD